MNIEPLKNLLKDSIDIKETLLLFLSKELQDKLIPWIYIQRNIYINDRILCIKKNTLELECIGRIISMGNGKIGIKISKYRNIFINPNNYYIFLKDKNKDEKKREIMQQLLERL
tara:strand:+ start:94 stop:435 length:342 start_codon:yes stop_codon:yes gene_type:complete